MAVVPFGLWRNIGRDILLSEEIIAVLREVLEGTIDFDQTFKDKYRKSHSSVPRPIHLHSGLGVLREVLEGTIDFDQTFKDKYRKSHSSVPRPIHLHSGLGMKGCAASNATSV